jgi:hypothetical protein
MQVQLLDDVVNERLVLAAAASAVGAVECASVDAFQVC